MKDIRATTFYTTLSTWWVHCIEIPSYRRVGAQNFAETTRYLENL